MAQHVKDSPVLEFDHLMICVSKPEEALRALTERGLTLGNEGVHRGQGTSNACFFFDNGYIELIWASDPSELAAAREIGLESRLDWARTGASPLGLSLRPTSSDHDWPFSTWDHAPPFLPEGAVPIPVLGNSRLLHEPLAFVSYFPGPPRNMQPPVPLQSTLGASEVTGLSISYRDERKPSAELQALRRLGLAEFQAGSTRHHAELTLDGGRQGQAESFEPVLPLSLRW